MRGITTPSAASLPSAAPTRWAHRLLLFLSAGLLVSLPALWILSQYFHTEVAGSLSYMVRDGWCEAGVFPGLGSHCFGDYSAQVLTARHDFGLPGFDVTKHVYRSDPTIAYNSLYTPIGQFPHVVSDLFLSGGAGQDTVFWFYIGILALAVGAPALWVAWLWRGTAMALIPLILLGVAAVPLISALDRGNSAALIVPLLLGFALSVGRDPPWIPPIFVVAAATVRPQFILLALAFIPFARWRQALASVIAFVGITLLSFATTAGGLGSSLPAWWGNVTSFRGVADPTVPSVANISLVRGVVIVGEWLADLPGPLGSLGGRLGATAIEQPLVIVAVASVAVALALWVSRFVLPRAVLVVVAIALPSMASTISPVYYLSFTLVIAALALGSLIVGGTHRGILDDPDMAGRPADIWRWLVVAATTLSLAPLPFGGGTAPDSTGWTHSFVLRYVGVVWFAILVATVVWLCVRGVRARVPRWSGGRTS